MKVVVSYINSKYSIDETIKKIDTSIADGIHVDLMDGFYVNKKNTLPDFTNITKPLDIHLMVNNPNMYFPKIIKLKPVCVYIHPNTSASPVEALNYLRDNKIKSGIVINPNENIDDFQDFFPFVDRVLLMSVIPGEGGQEFIEETSERLKYLKQFQFDFEVYVDGGINAESIKKVALAEGVVSGSFICNSDDFNKQIKLLKEG